MYDRLGSSSSTLGPLRELAVELDGDGEVLFNLELADPLLYI